MKTGCARVSIFLVGMMLASIVRGAGSWDSYSPQSVPQGTGIYLNGWGWVNGLNDVKANIYVDGNIVGQASMTDSRPDIVAIYGPGNWGWHFTINTSSLSIGNHNITVWIGSNSQGQWQSYSQSIVQQSGSFTVTQPVYPDLIRFIGIPNKNISQNVPLRGTAGFDQPYYRNTYSDLNNAFGSNVAAYWGHWDSHGFNEYRSPFSLGNAEGSAYSRSGLPVSFSVVSGPAYISNNTVYFNGVGTVILRAHHGGGTVAATGKIFSAAHGDVSFSVGNNAPTVSWHTQMPAAINYVGGNLVARAVGSDPDGNLTNVKVEYAVRPYGGGWGGWNELAVNGGGNGYTSVTDPNGVIAGAPGTTYRFQSRASDPYTSSAWHPSNEYTIANRAPYGPALSASGSGITYNSTYGHYEMHLGGSITLNASVADYDGNLSSHSIWRVVSPGISNEFTLLTTGSGGAPNSTATGGSSSAKTLAYTPLIAGRYDFHTNGQDSLGASSLGASITLYAYGDVNNAEVISQTVNGTAASTTAVDVNANFSVAIVMRNSGTKPWNSDATPHRLGAVGEVTTWGMTRISLPVTVAAPFPQPGSDVTFSFTATAPSVSGVYNFQWQMVEDGIQWFGAMAPQVTITVNGPPKITSHPQTQTVNSGGNVTLSVVASGPPAPSSYQWKKNGTDIVGATAASLALTNVQPSAAGNYSVVVTNSKGSTTSNVATLTVNSAPAFTSHPQSQTVNAGNSVTLSGSASGLPAPTYQWRKGGVAISGATASTLTLSNVQPAAAGSYDLVASNNLGSATSTPAIVTVNFPPAITTQPQSQAAGVGASVTFSVGAVGSPAVTYQWRKNGVNISGATSASLTLTNLQVSAEGAYSVVVSNSLGAVTSSNAQLTLEYPDVNNENELNIHLPHQ